MSKTSVSHLATRTGTTVATPPSPAPSPDSEVPSVARGDLSHFPRPPLFEDPYKARAYWKGRLAAAFRIFAKYGYDEGVAGHITLRDPVEPDTFWVNPFGNAFELIKSSDLIRVDEQGNVIEGGPNKLLNNAAFMIHSAIHQARPDVMAACHSHTVHGRAFCTLGRTLDTTTQDSCAFHNDHVVYDSFNGVVMGANEGHDIAKTLGRKKAAILQNHGLLTVGQNVDEAVWWFVTMDKLCYSQLMADSAAALYGKKPIPIDEETAQYTFKLIGNPMAGWFSAKPIFDVIHKETKGEYLDE